MIIRKLCLLFVTAAALSACAAMPSHRLNIAEDKILPEPSLEKIADGVWIHKSYEFIEPWGPILSQGLVLKATTGVYLIDTAWNDADTNKLLNLIHKEIGEFPTTTIITHAHEDKMGGMNTIHNAKIESYAHPFANEDAPIRNLIQAGNNIWFDSGLWWKDIKIETGNDGHSRTISLLEVYYPGPGHTRDNIVVYYEPAKILFGGCLIRPRKSSNLGNTADADIANWANAVRNVAAEFPDAEIIIPSHGRLGGRELFDHTIALAEAADE